MPSTSAACSAGARAPPSGSASSARRQSAGGRCDPVSGSFRRPSRGAWCGAFVWSGPWWMELSIRRYGRATPRGRPRPRVGCATGRSSGKPSNAARGARPTSSARLGVACGRSPSTTGRAESRDGPRRWSRPGRRRGPRATGRSRGHRLESFGAALADQRGDRLGVLERRRRRELDVERDQRRTRRRPAPRRRSDEACSDRSPGSALRTAIRVRERRGAAAAKLGPRPSLRELAVQEHRQLELVAEQVAERRAPPRRRRRGRADRGRRSGRRRSRRRGGGCPRGRSGRRCGRLRRRRSSTAFASSPGSPASVNTLRW